MMADPLRDEILENFLGPVDSFDRVLGYGAQRPAATPSSVRRYSPR